MNRVLVTGAGGFTGRYLAAALAERGIEVFGTGTADGASGADALFEYFPADLADTAALRAILREVRPDGIVHLAGIAFVAHGDVSEIYAVNLLGTRGLLDAVARSEVPVSAVVLASSANIYGNAREGLLDETLPPNPANDYAVSKAAMELVAGLYRERLPIVVVRPFNYTGRGQSTRFLIPKIVDHARRRAPVIELGNLDVWRDFSDVRAVAQAYCRLLECPGAIGRTVNICSGRLHSLREILALVGSLGGHEMDVRVNPAFVRRNEVRRMRGDDALLTGLIGPLGMPPIEQTLAWMLED